MPDQHRAFFAQLPFLLAGSVDELGRPWASLLCGPPGFAASPHPQILQVAALPAAGDPLSKAIVEGARIGLLGIELPTRRRNRVNGSIAAADDEGFALMVEESFGNCPQYIQRRDYAALRGASGSAAEPFSVPDDAAQALIGRSDTFFVASASASGSAVISHRGGRPGFVGIDGDGALVIPDYRGNRFFNTLGNLVVNPRAGLLFIDFASGDLLQLTGTAEIVWGGAAVDAFAGAERLWRLTPTSGNWLRGGFRWRMELRDASPTVAGTGTWSEAVTELAGRPR
jgi:hypothetical protein